MLNRILISVVINLFLLTALFAQNEKISTRLQNALKLTPENETQKIWIYFTDKGGNIDSKLKSVESNLSERSKNRRSKSMKKNIVDRFDIPINSNYLREIASYTEKITVKSKWLNAISAEVKSNNINLIATKSFIKKLDIVGKFKKHQPVESMDFNYFSREKNIHSYNYGGSYTQNAQIKVPEIHDLGITGSGVLICMLDNNYYMLNHETFSSMDILTTWDFINDESTVNDPRNEGDHGTRTLSTVGGFTPGSLIGPAFGATYMLGKTEVSGSETPIEEDYWVAGAEWADSWGADILSSSLSYDDWYTWRDMDGNTAVTTIGADIAAGRGILVVTSAGNNGMGQHNTLGAPADGDSVIAVASVTSSGIRATSSSVGPSADGRTKPDVAAMGAWVTVADPDNATGYELSSGTSFSCPLTSGVAALVLSANPSLTAMQVRDALRETASQATSPDNELGWGILNAYDAVFYFKAKITHSQINNTEDLNGPYEITAEIESTLPLIPSEIKLVYGPDTNFGSEIVMQPTGNPDAYNAQIAGTGSAAEYFYYVQAKNDQQIITYLPFNAPNDYFRFYAGPDTVVPVISHNNLNNQPLLRWPAIIKAEVSDNIGIDSVWVEYRINSGGIESFRINNVTVNMYEGTFPVASGLLNAADVIEYRINAIDNSTAGNVTILPDTGYYSFEMIDVSGVDYDLGNNTPQQFTLLQNYPNPFNPQTTIKYAIPNSGYVELIIYNLIGQQVYQIYQGYKKAGLHKLVFNGSRFSSGIYFYNLKTKEVSGKIFSKTRKMVYIK